MSKALRIVAAILMLVLILVGGGVGWYIHTKQPVRDGTAKLQGIQAAVRVAFDERGVPHVKAQNEADMYRALGYLHAQDRLFQMEMARRLARGELAEVYGPKLLETDKLFRTLGLRSYAEATVQRLDKQSASYQALLAYLDGINQFQATHPLPVEFDMLQLKPRPFTPEDSLAVTGYLAYSFAKAFVTEPSLTYIRDKLGPQYLQDFDIDWHAEGVIQSALSEPSVQTRFAKSQQKKLPLSDKDWQALEQLATLSQSTLELTGVPALEGSNAWVISGKHTSSRKPILAGDPHIAYSLPATWWEAHTSIPGFDLYGHYQVLNPFAFLGHNMQFGWSLTMLQNDDMDLVAEKVNPENPNQVWINGEWKALQEREETISVRGASPVTIKVRSTPHGPIINDVYPGSFDKTPIAMWWTFQQTENPLLDAFYQLDRADTREKARNAASLIASPGLNVVWASANGDIAWWAAGKFPIRPDGINPSFILDASKGEADKNGFYRFDDNPQEENPARGYIVSANQQPLPRSGVPVPGYYNPADRANVLNRALSNPDREWNIQAVQALQISATSGHAKRLLDALLPALRSAVSDPLEKDFLEPLSKWDYQYTRDSIAATMFNQLVYEFAHEIFTSKLGETQFKNLIQTRAIDNALVLIASNPDSVWWKNPKEEQKDPRTDTLRKVWHNTLEHLKKLYGTSLLEMTWGHTHTITMVHPLGRIKPLDWLFNVGPFPVAGGREAPNNMSYGIGPAPWAVTYGPSTRRVIDFKDASYAQGINPVGQSGVLFDEHYKDQIAMFIEGESTNQWLIDKDIKSHTKSLLVLKP